MAELAKREWCFRHTKDKDGEVFVAVALFRELPSLKCRSMPVQYSRARSRTIRYRIFRSRNTVMRAHGGH